MFNRKNRRQSWELTFEYFLNREEVRRLRKWVNKNHVVKNDRVSQNEWFLIECLLNTGLRVAELANLRCGDVIIRNELSCIHVRNGKGGKSRDVLINKEFQSEAAEYLKWKIANNEKTGKDDMLLCSPYKKKGYSTRALQLTFKRSLNGAGINAKHSIHHLRHTYASLLLIASKNNLPLVQKQLGHSSITITQVYTNVFKEELKFALEHLLPKV